MTERMLWMHCSSAQRDTKSASRFDASRKTPVEWPSRRVCVKKRPYSVVSARKRFAVGEDDGGRNMAIATRISAGFQDRRDYCNLDIHVRDIGPTPSHCLTAVTTALTIASTVFRGRATDMNVHPAYTNLEIAVTENGLGNDAAGV